jgi:DedD protein
MDQMLKQRLIGAIVIIALAVIFIPMILEGPDKELSTRTQNMPPPPAIDYPTEVELPVPAASSESPEPAETPATAAPEQQVSALPESAVPPAEPAAAPAPPPASVKPVEPVAKPPAPKPAVAKPPPPSDRSAPKTASVVSQGGWVLQVGSFSQQGNAQSLRDRLKKAGYQVSMQVAKGADGSIHRVLVGPVSDRPMAEKLRDRLAREQKLTAMVLENK